MSVFDFEFQRAIGTPEEHKENLNKIEQRLANLNIQVRSANADQLEALETEIEDLLERKEISKRKLATAEINAGKDNYTIIESRDFSMDNIQNREKENKDLELRAFQKYIAGGGTLKNLTEVEERALNVSGSAAVLPTEIYTKLITNEKYSDLLFRATIIDAPNMGTVKIPIASNTSASWKLENSNEDGDSNTYEATPSLTSIDLKAYELYRWSRISAAAASQASGNFIDQMLTLLQSEVIETLEKSFVSGSGTGQPKGLENLSFTEDTNAIYTASAATPISASDIAEAISLLGQRYARNAVILVNADTLYNISMFRGTSEYAFDLSTGATKFMGKEIIVNENVADDEIYIVDPKELYVRFAQPIQIEANTSSGFTSASVDLRCLAVVDAAFNPKAVVKVAVGTGE